MGFCQKNLLSEILLDDNYRSNERAGSRHKDNGKELHISQHKYQITPCLFCFSNGKTK